MSKAVAKILPDAVIVRAMERALTKQGGSEGEGKWFTLLSHMSDFSALGSVYKQLEAYQGHVYKVVNLISNRLSTIPFRLEYERGTESAVIDRHVFYDLAKKPNPIWNFRQLIKFADMHLELTGRAFWRKVRGSGNQTVELWPMVPSSFSKLVTQSGEGGPIITGYVFFMGGIGGAVKEITIPAEDIIDFRFPHPTLMLDGASPIQAAAYAYDTDLAMRVYERRFFHNSARPDIILSSDQTINEDDAARIVRLWNQKFQGVDKKYNEPAVMGKGMSVETLTVSNKDLEFMVLKDWTKEDIFETYGAPPSMLGTIKEFRRDQMFASEMIFARECLTPRSLLMAETITGQLIHDYDQNLKLVFSSAIPDDPELNLKTRESNLKSGYSSINIEREKNGEDPVPWGDAPFLPINLLQYGESRSNGGNGSPAKSLNLAKGIADDDRRRARFHQLHARRVLSRSKPVENYMRKYFRDQEKEVMRNFDTQFRRIEGATSGMSRNKMNQWIEEKAAFDSINIDVRKWDETLTEGLTPFMTLAVETAGQDAIELLDVGFEFDVHNEISEAMIGQHIRKIVGVVNPETHQAIRAALQTGFDNGETMNQIAERIRNEFDFAKQVRSLRIARTEINAATNLGNLEGYKQSGVVEGKEWINGAGARESHLIAGATYREGGSVGPIKLDEYFDVGEGRTKSPGNTGIAKEDIN